MPLDAATRNAIIGAMRRVWHRHSFRLSRLKQAEVRQDVLTKSGEVAKRPQVFYVCAHCGTYCKIKANGKFPKVAVDHVDPVIPVDAVSPLGLDQIAARMFVEGSALDVLCEPCHRIKTNAENADRRQYKKAQDVPND